MTQASRAACSGGCQQRCGGHPELRDFPAGRATDQAIRASAVIGRPGNMNDLNAAELYDRELTHLVRAHRAEPGRLTAAPLTLGQFRWVHFDTHAALDMAQMRPPDGHVHPELVDPGRPGEPVLDWRPFEPSPSGALDLPTTKLPRFVAMTVSTGLPQTGMCADQDAGDLTGRWPSVVLAELRAHFQSGPEPDRALAGFLDDLRHFRDPAAAGRAENTGCAVVARHVLRQISRLKGSTGFLAPPTGPGDAAGRAARRPARPLPRQARGR